MAANKPSSYRLPEDVKQLLKLLCKKNVRNEAQQIEWLIREAAKKEGIKLSDKSKSPG